MYPEAGMHDCRTCQLILEEKWETIDITIAEKQLSYRLRNLEQFSVQN